LILIDPKMLELASYKDIPHLRVPVVTEAKRAKGVLLWAVNEMERRYRLMKKYGVRSIDGYNDIVEGNVPEDEQRESEAAERDATEASGLADGAVVEQEPIVSSEPQNEELQFVEKLEKLPKLVIVIDELADLMLAVGRDIEDLIARLAQKARAAGIHLIVATQRPSVNVITGLIKANFPARLSFRVTSRVDSQTILDSKGAEALLGKGDMLFMRPGEVHAQRLHGAFVADPEVLRVVGCIKKGCKPHYDTRILEMCDKLLEEQDGESGGSSGMDEDYDAFYDEAVQFILEKGKASTSMLQRRFKIGYNRAARIIDTMESEGIVGPIDGSRPRQVIAPGGEDQQI
jgi:S-DNA-T family DNA segregation ATPase FtsK/SpoIIIE